MWDRGIGCKFQAVMGLFPWPKSRSLMSMFSGACISFSWFVSLQQRYETMDQCYSSVTAQPLFTQTDHTYTCERWGEGETLKKWSQPVLAPPVDTFCLLPPEPGWFALCKVGLAQAIRQEGGVFFPTGVSHSSPWIFLCSLFLRLFPFFVCLLAANF